MLKNENKWKYVYALGDFIAGLNSKSMQILA